MKPIEFKKTDKYRIIKYMVNKVPYVKARINMLEQLGFKVVLDSVKEKNYDSRGRVFFDKQNRLRMQISNNINNKTYAYYVIL